MRIILVSLLFLSFSNTSYARKNDTILKHDTAYYVSLRNKLTAYVFGVNKFSQFNLENSTSESNLTYKPNTKFNLGLGFDYKWLALSSTFNFNIFNDDQIYGKSACFDIQSDFMTRRSLISLNLQSYKGFYWENAEAYVPGFTKLDTNVVRPDIETFQLGVNYIYTFNNDRFSFKTAFSKTGWQKKSAGSMLVGGFFSIYGLSADSSIVPLIAKNDFALYDSLYSLSAINIGVSLGYTYTYVWRKKLFINGTLMFGLLNQTFSTYDNDGNLIDSENNLSSKTHFRMAFGFNNHLQSFGLALVVDSFLIPNENESEFVYNYGKVNLFYARRFNIKRSFRFL